MTKEQALQRYFGFRSFRPGQAEIIDAVLAGHDTLAVLPTGGGKSVCFQLPALLLPGLTVVVTPLISLMEDQVRALRENGIAAAYLNGSLTKREQDSVLYHAAHGAYRLLYVAPERLTQPAFLGLIETVRVSLVVVDEAHCVSQWGQDFRPSYLNIAPFVEHLQPRPGVCAFTATATPRVRSDVAALLGLRAPQTFVLGFDRANLYFETVRPTDKALALRRRLDLYVGRSGIVYCASRKTVDSLFAALSAEGRSVCAYHAGMEPAARLSSQWQFLRDERRVMLATNAFGMGIDKPNVSFVLHYDMPGDLESYYQEAGRAGRDGLPADCILFYSARDVQIQRYFIETATENDDLDEHQRKAVRRNKEEKLAQMIDYANTSACLRAELLRYFGEQPPHRCGNCSSCCGARSGTDVTVEAQKILSCVARCKTAVSPRVVTQILKGERSPAVVKQGYAKLSTFGIMQEFDRAEIDALLWLLVEQGYLRTDVDARLSLDDSARRVLFEKQPVRRAARTAPAASDDETAVDRALLARLRQLCKTLAAQSGVPPFAIFTDRVLLSLATLRPQDEAAFSAVPGVSRRKSEKYAALFLKEIRKKTEEPTENS